MFRFGFFLSQKQKTKHKFMFLFVFRLWLFETNYFSSCTQPHFLHEKGDFTRVFDTHIQRTPTASERQNSTEIVRKRFRSRKHTFPYPAANRLIIVNEKDTFNGNGPFEVKSVQTVQVVSLVASFGRTAGGERGKSGPANEGDPL